MGICREEILMAREEGPFMVGILRMNPLWSSMMNQEYLAWLTQIDLILTEVNFILHWHHLMDSMEIR